MRTYDLRADELAELAMLGSGLPDWYLEWVHRWFRVEHEPRWIGLEPVEALVGRELVRVERHAVVYPRLELIELTLFAPVTYAVAQQRENGFVVDRAGWTATSEDASWSQSMQWASDQTYTELTRRRVTPTSPRRAGLDTIAYYCVAKPDGETVGLYDEDRCSIRTTQLRVETTRSVTELDEGVGGYISLGGTLLRDRHLVGRIEAEVVATARGILAGKRENGYLTPWQGVHLASRIQAKAIVAQSEISNRGIFRFGRPVMSRLHAWASPYLGLRSEDRAALDNATNALQGLSASVVGTAIDRSQRLFALGGLIFGVLSIGFSSIAVLTVVQAQPHDTRLWVLWALIAALATGAVLFGLAYYLVEQRVSERQPSKTLSRTSQKASA